MTCFFPRPTPDAPSGSMQRIATNRRDFLRMAAGVGLSSKLTGFIPFLRGVSSSRVRKAIVITFGGGARDQETFAPEGQENIPNLIEELIPQSTFFTQVINRGILGHYVATASLATGVYESINNFASLPPEHPTMFEYFRKDLKRPAPDAWVFSPTNAFNPIPKPTPRPHVPAPTPRI